jgi:tRNA-dihydrouridine synthase
MIGRGIFGNPWLFNREITSSDISTADKLNALIEHTKIFEEKLGDIKNFAIMKKHYKAYVSGFDGAEELRIKLMEAENVTEVKDIVNDYLS